MVALRVRADYGFVKMVCIKVCKAKLILSVLIFLHSNFMCFCFVTVSVWCGCLYMRGGYGASKFWRTNILVLFSMLMYATNYVVCRIFFLKGGEVSQFIIFRSIISMVIAYRLIIQYEGQKSMFFVPFDYIDNFIEFEDEEPKIDQGDLSNGLSSDVDDNEFSTNVMTESDTNLFPILMPKDNFAIYVASIAGAFRQLIMQIALKYTFARNAGVIQPSVPIVTAILGQWLGIEDVSFVTYFCILISAVGLFVSMDIFYPNVGVLLLLSVPIAKAIQVIGLKIATSKLDKSLVHTYQILILVGMTLPISLIYQFLSGNLLSLFYITFVQACCIVYSAVSVVYVAWKIQILGVKIIGPIRVSLFQAIQPCFTIFLEYMFLGEQVTVRVLIGTLIVIAALVIQMMVNDGIDLNSGNLEMHSRLLPNP